MDKLDVKKKEQTHRLITKGALLEKYFEIADFSIDETEALLRDLQSIATKQIKTKKERLIFELLPSK